MVPAPSVVVLDGAHNPAGVETLVAELAGLGAGAGPVVAVVSVLDYKDAAGMVAALAPAADLLVATRSSHPRAAAPARLAALARDEGTAAVVVDAPAPALARAREEAGPGGTVVVAGSLYLLADLRPRVLPAGLEPPARLRARPAGRPPTRANIGAHDVGPRETAPL